MLDRASDSSFLFSTSEIPSNTADDLDSDILGPMSADADKTDLL